MPAEFYRHICQEKMLLYLNGKNVLQTRLLQIISGFIDAIENNYRLLQNNRSSYKTIFQYVYPNVFPEIYCSTEKIGFHLTSNFHIMFKTYKDKKQLEKSMGKNPANYETIRKETNIYEQKPVNIDGFNEYEEAEVKERVQKQEKKAHCSWKKQTVDKRKRKNDQKKIKEKDKRECLAKLNSEFKDVKKAKKESKKMSETIIN